MNKNLPKRANQHILETASFKLFVSKIPDSWVIRDLTERDYGIDCYLEIVNAENELTGQVVLIQLKATKNIKWTKEGTHNIRGIKKTTTNYWNNFKIPVFIFLADIEEKELYFVSVNHFIKRHFHNFDNESIFNYQVRKSEKFNGPSDIRLFEFYNYFASNREKFESEIILFFSLLNNYTKFIGQYRVIEKNKKFGDIELFNVELLYNNFQFLCTYCNVDRQMPTFIEIEELFEKENRVNSYIQRTQNSTSKVHQQIETNFKILLKALKEFLKGEEEYWSKANQNFYWYFIGIDENGEYKDYNRKILVVYEHIYLTPLQSTPQ